jgi:hypothetical protein
VIDLFLFFHFFCIVNNQTTITRSQATTTLPPGAGTLNPSAANVVSKISNVFASFWLLLHENSCS